MTTRTQAERHDALFRDCLKLFDAECPQRSTRAILALIAERLRTEPMGNWRAMLLASPLVKGEKG
jgi:hypothetical protein